MSKDYNFTDLVSVMAQLRDPDHGCPWDLEQTFQTIIKHTIEEAYEVQDAIINNDMANLKEELGDLLLQSVYHSQIASEQNLFSIDDVVTSITDKMIRRHPHVFGDASAKTASDVDAIWEDKKDQEKSNAPSSALDGVPAALPALIRSHKLQKKAAKVGFEWDDISGVLDKISEEIAEVEDAKASNDKDHIAEELGDLLFVLVNYIRMSDFQAEDLLTKANHKFYTRFSLMEDMLKNDNIDIKNVGLDTKEDYWQRAKKHIKLEKSKS